MVAFELLRAVDEDRAFANLVLPRLIGERGLEGRDAAFATELGYGAVRAAGTLDAILARCVDRDLQEVDPAALDLLRLGAYQQLRTRIPSHAAVATTVDLAHEVGSGRAGGFVNAVLRKVAAHDWDSWVDMLSQGQDELHRLALATAHPYWIAAAFAAALGEDPETPVETGRALAADDERPVTHLTAWPGRCDPAELLAESGGVPGRWSPYAVLLEHGGDPGALAAIRERRAGVQDEGSQLCALALARADLDGPDERWLDLCAGPGGKAALLAAVGAQRTAVLTANELREHRARLVEQVTEPWGVTVQVGDARTLTGGPWDRVLLDAPCTGLGALRRRPEVRWRRSADDTDDFAELTALQRDLLAAALQLTRPGGVVAYVTCSPHPAETTRIVTGHDLIDARPAFPGVPDLGDGPTVQLWPHRHGTDAMFCALIRAH